METIPLRSNFIEMPADKLRSYEGREIIFLMRGNRTPGSKGFIKSINIGSRSAKVVVGPNEVIEQSLDVLYFIPATKEELTQEKLELENELTEAKDKLQFLEESGQSMFDTLQFQVDRIRKKIGASTQEEITDIITKLIKRDK